MDFATILFLLCVFLPGLWLIMMIRHEIRRRLSSAEQPEPNLNVRQATPHQVRVPVRGLLNAPAVEATNFATATTAPDLTTLQPHEAVDPGDSFTLAHLSKVFSRFSHEMATNTVAVNTTGLAHDFDIDQSFTLTNVAEAFDKFFVDSEAGPSPTNYKSL